MPVCVVYVVSYRTTVLCALRQGVRQVTPSEAACALEYVVAASGPSPLCNTYTAMANLLCTAGSTPPKRRPFCPNAPPASVVVVKAVHEGPRMRVRPAAAAAGERHGEFGVLEESGGRYYGGLHGNKKAGLGVYELSNGDRFFGEFRDDRYDGYGVMEYADGNRHLGMYQHGGKHGFGVRERPDGDEYLGQYALGYAHGRAVWLRKGGRMTYDTWSNGHRMASAGFNERDPAHAAVLRAAMEARVFHPPPPPTHPPTHPPTTTRTHNRRAPHTDTTRLRARSHAPTIVRSRPHRALRHGCFVGRAAGGRCCSAPIRDFAHRESQHAKAWQTQAACMGYNPVRDTMPNGICRCFAGTGPSTEACSSASQGRLGAMIKLTQSTAVSPDPSPAPWAGTDHMPCERG